MCLCTCCLAKKEKWVIKILSFHSTFPPLSPLYSSFSLLPLFLSLSSSSFCSLTPSAPLPFSPPSLYSLSVLHCPSHTEYCSVLHSPSDRKVFLATWKEIPPSNEVQTSIDNISLSAGMQWNIRTRDASFVPCREVVPISEGPLWEAPLYTMFVYTSCVLLMCASHVQCLLVALS